MSTIAIVTTTRAPLQDTLRHVDHHLRSGVDHFLVFFDDPHDPAIDVLKSNDKVTAIPCDADYWKHAEKSGQTELLAHRLFINADAALAICRKRGYDWLIHIDGDEYLRPRRPLHEVLDRARKDVVRFAIREVVPERDRYDDPFREATLFRKPAPAINLFLARALCPRAFFYGEYFRGHSVSKCAVRVNSGIRYMGVHAPREEKVDIEDTRSVELLHYDAADLDAWVRKCQMREDSAVKSPVRENRRRQFDAFPEAVRRGGQAVADLYRRLYFIPRHEQLILFGLGLLTRIPSSCDEVSP